MAAAPAPHHALVMQFIAALLQRTLGCPTVEAHQQALQGFLDDLTPWISPAELPTLLEQPFTLQPILQQYLPAAADDSLLANMQVTSGTATAVLSPLSFQLSLSLNDPITLATNVAFENIYLMLEGSTASGMGGSAYATFDVDGRKAVFEVTASSVRNPFRLRELNEFSCPSGL